jgi:sigma-B regulation protein RsbU (phosphoserine phosphatase)
MPAPLEGYFRDQIQERQRRLEAALAQGLDAPQLRRLLAEVDAALERLEHGTFGLCDTCHDPIEPDRLLADPFLRNCIDHLTADEQRALQRDLDLAGEIQGALLPKGELATPSWDDVCDLIRSRDGGPMVFVVGDVAGKGVAASLLMAHLSATFRSLVAADLPLDRIMDRANDLFCSSITAQHYATLACGRAGADGDLELCNAGHAPIYLLRPGGVAPLRSTGLPLGMFCTSTYAIHRTRLAAGEAVFLYTDGLSEARDGAGVEYGAERLGRFLQDHRAADPSDLIPACLEDLRGFLGGRPLADDLTVMALRYRAGNA